MERTLLILELLKFNFDSYVSWGNAVGIEEMRDDVRLGVYSVLGPCPRTWFVSVLPPELTGEHILVEEGQQ